MPGITSHLIAGWIMTLIGLLIFRNYFNEKNVIKRRLLLFLTCMFFSFIPDIFLGIYYATHILPKKVLMPYHLISHRIFSPIGIIALTGMSLIDRKRMPYWFMGLLSLIVHLLMDLYIEETGLYF